MVSRLGAGGIGGLLATRDMLGTAANERAVDLGGQDAHIAVPDSSLLVFGNADHTIEAWVKLNSLSGPSTEPQFVVMKRAITGTDVGADYAFMAQAGSHGTTGRELTMLWGDGVDDVTLAVSNLEIDDTAWHYVSAAFIAATGQVRFVLDDVTETITVTDEGHIVSGPDGQTLRDLTIGVSPAGGGAYTGHLNGLLDEVRVSRGQVGATEQLNADPSVWPEEADVVGYWRFETAGATVADVSGNGLDGTVIGTGATSTGTGGVPLVALPTDHVYFHDANGNVGQLVEATHPSEPGYGDFGARYEYGPYGGTLVATVRASRPTMATTCPRPGSTCPRGTAGSTPQGQTRAVWSNGPANRVGSTLETPNPVSPNDLNAFLPPLVLMPTDGQNARSFGRFSHLVLA